MLVNLTEEQRDQLCVLLKDRERVPSNYLPDKYRPAERSIML